MVTTMWAWPVVAFVLLVLAGVQILRRASRNVMSRVAVWLTAATWSAMALTVGEMLAVAPGPPATRALVSIWERNLVGFLLVWLLGSIALAVLPLLSHRRSRSSAQAVVVSVDR